MNDVERSIRTVKVEDINGRTQGSRVKVLALLLRIDENTWKIDDGTGSLKLIIDEENDIVIKQLNKIHKKNLTLDRPTLIKIVGYVRYDKETQQYFLKIAPKDYIQNYSGLNISLYRKVQNLKKKLGENN